jgi:hypothetical protein
MKKRFRLAGLALAALVGLGVALFMTRRVLVPR